MIKLLVDRQFRGEKEVLAEVYLVPEIWGYGGMVEVASERARVNAEALGRLLATLLEKQVLTLEECCIVAGVSREDVKGEIR